MGRRRAESLSVLKSMFGPKSYEEVDENLIVETDNVKSEFVVMGHTTKQTLTLAFTNDSIQVFLHGDEGISLVETVHFKHIKAVTAASKNVCTVDWDRGPYRTHDVSRFITTNGEAKQMQARFYRNIRALTANRLV